ncbi:MAG: hypothetical protein LBE09_02895, partial [Christensenellaceae bacterium]|nr:hypothetical protein [Christensenellaceae bacterium]
MSVAYFISTNNEINQKYYGYSQIIKNNKPILCDEEGIIFDDKLWDTEQFALGDIFQQRYNYSIRSTVELGF